MKIAGLPPKPSPVYTAVTASQAPQWPIDEEVKAQPVRVMDVAVFGPLTILGALNKEPPTWMRLFLLAYGVGTILYNGYNFLEIERRKQLQTPPE